MKKKHWLQGAMITHNLREIIKVPFSKQKTTVIACNLECIWPLFHFRNRFITLVYCLLLVPRLFCPYKSKNDSCIVIENPKYTTFTSCSQEQNMWIIIYKKVFKALVEFCKKKSRIRETPALSTDADSRTNTIVEKLLDFFLFFL